MKGYYEYAPRVGLLSPVTGGRRNTGIVPEASAETAAGTPFNPGISRIMEDNHE